MTAPLPATAWEPDRAPPSGRRVFVLRTSRQRGRRLTLLAGAIAMGVVAVIAAVAYALGAFGSGFAPFAGSMSGEGRVTLPAAVRETARIYDTEIMPLAPDEASAINAERPVDVTAVIPARALAIARESASGAGYGAALRCLTQAVYYEAASEPDAGQQAVAQVVLNRVRHVAFPNTVCGVVYQGSERVTGCQFSFTCDGSLARIPSVGGWARAERVARAALGGSVAPAVGNATHYHANYVVPYWAPTLDKVTTVGAHIFYLMRGFMGTPRAFTSRYDVEREVPHTAPLIEPGGVAVPALEGAAPALAAPEDPLGTGIAPSEDLRSGRLILGTGTPAFSGAPSPALRADEARGELKVGSGVGGLKADEGRAPPATPAPAASPQAP